MKEDGDNINETGEGKLDNPKWEIRLLQPNSRVKSAMLCILKNTSGL